MDSTLLLIGIVVLIMAIAGCTAPPTSEEGTYNDTVESEWDEARSHIWNPLESGE